MRPHSDEYDYSFDEKIRIRLDDSGYKNYEDYFVTLNPFFDGTGNVLKYGCIVVKNNEKDVAKYTEEFCEILKDYSPKPVDYYLDWRGAAVYIEIR